VATVSALLLPGMEGEARDFGLSQWFTPPALASRVWEWAKLGGPHRTVLEPSAGNGALVKPVLADPGECVRVLAVEVDCSHVLALSSLQRLAPRLHVQVMPANFLEAPSDLLGFFDLALLNPPYENGATEVFIQEALRYADRAVVIAQGSVLHGQERARTLWPHVDITRGVWLSARPCFGIGESGSEGGKRDFVVLELQKRQRPRKAGESMACEWQWW
jgi:predicted RNA methylase